MLNPEDLTKRVEQSEWSDQIGMSENRETVELSDLIGVKREAVKRCRYTGCENLIPSDSTFPYCDTCRTLAARNAVSLVLDPVSPHPLERVKEVTHTLLTNLTGEEIIRFNERLEELYLDTCKAIKAHGLKSEPKRARTVEDAIEEARQINEAGSIRAKQQQKREKKNVSRIQKLQNLLGVDEKKAKEIMGEEFDL